MKKFKRVFVIVLDSLGIGYAPDAKDFGDEGANTLLGISESKELFIPNLESLGLGHIEGIDCIRKSCMPLGSYARLRELSRGKDTTVGHWELMGVISDKPLPTYPDGFPPEIINELEMLTGRGVLCNKAYSGTEVIKDYGEEHLRSGKLIVYTSADSVFQIAAHEDIVPPSLLYKYCEAARKILTGEHGVGRVIARPFESTENGFHRTDRRRDFSLAPPKPTALDAISQAGLDVIAVGKITDIFAGKGITESIYTHSNDEGMNATVEIAHRDFRGLCFTNLVDFDMLYGHRQDKDGYARALSCFDRRLTELISLLGADDALIITADHGCDPTDSSTDHTREYVPLLIYSKGLRPMSFGTINGFSAVGALVCDMLHVDADFEHAEHIFREFDN